MMNKLSLDRKRLLRVLIALLGIGVFFLIIGIVRISIDQFQPLRFGVVIQNKLYRADTTNWKVMKRIIEKHNIKIVIELISPEVTEEKLAEKKKLLNELGVNYYSFFMWGDGIATPELYADILEAIEKSIEAGKPVLVKCAAGVKRTGSTIALYRVLIQKYPPQLAYSELKDYCPRRFWDKKLVNHLNSNMVAIATLLHQRGILHKKIEVPPVLKGD